MLKFNKKFSPEYGKVTKVTPLIRRLVAHNPSPFTFYGTGTYIVGENIVNRKNIAIIDPGPAIASHLQALEKLLETATVSHILVTHNHLDHSPAAKPLKQMTGAEIYAFDPGQQADMDNRAEEGQHTEESCDQNFAPDHILQDGDVITGDGWTLEAVHTPGHLPNHLCFALKEEKALFTGDHVMGWSTSVIAEPGGDMKDYMISLEKLLSRDDQIYYPTHGAPIENPKPYVKALIAHRRARERQILAAIADGAVTIPEIVALIYCDIPSYLHPAAACSVHAHLIHMTEEGRVKCQDDMGKAGIFTSA